jgi:hypothetical protein
VAAKVARTRRAPERRTGPEARFRQVEPERPAEAAHELEIGAGSTAAIEQLRVRQAVGGAGEERLDEPPEAPEPEVARLGPGRRAEQMVHARIVSFASQHYHELTVLYPSL